MDASKAKRELKFNLGDKVWFIKGKYVSDVCPTCNGVGETEASFGVRKVTVNCPDCGGSGKMGVLKRKVEKGEISARSISYKERVRMYKPDSTEFIDKDIYDAAQAMYDTSRDESLVIQYNVFGNNFSILEKEVYATEDEAKAQLEILNAEFKEKERASA